MPRPFPVETAATRNSGTGVLCSALVRFGPATRRTLTFRSLIRPAVVASLFALPGAVSAGTLPDDDYANLSRAAIDHVVIPAYTAYARAARQLGPAIERHCIGPAALDTTAVRAAFGEAMDAWQRAWPFGFGPVEQGAGDLAGTRATDVDVGASRSSDLGPRHGSHGLCGRHPNRVRRTGLRLMVSSARRRFLAILAFIGAAPRMPAADEPGGVRFIGCRTDPRGRNLASVFDARGRIVHDVPLPGRGHGFAVQPCTGCIAVFARRPGDWTLILDPGAGAVTGRLATNEGRHFYGHGAFSPDGRFLYTSENRFEDGAGVIGVWHAGGEWRRIGEWPSRGVGPHELRVFDRGRLLAVANGGIRTHPDTGRARLNLDAMASSLAILETSGGRLLRSASLDAGNHRLSIRHLDVHGDTRLVVAMQHHGSHGERVPLIAFERDARLEPVYAPDDVRRRMRRYAGSVSFDVTGRYAAVSHPHEGIVTLWAARPARLLAVAELADTCGVARGASAGSFIATGAHGQIMHVDAPTGESHVLNRTDGAHWDNHLLAL